MSSAVRPDLCPLCVEPLDATDRSLQLCPCGFSLCLFCWKKIMESESGRCPNCREAYDQSKIVSLPSMRTDEVSSDDAPNKRKKKKADRKKGIKLSGQERRNLQELRILQKNLVYAVGLSLDICIESVLAQNEFFGQFGPLKKISVNRSSPYSTGQSKNGPTGAAYVTFERDDDAADCVSAVDGAVWDGHYIRACFGTTKYCQAFLKGAQCNNPDCLYMHYLVNEGTFTKEEMNSGFSKSRPEFYNLINFDRSKGPVPGSLAKPPKGPGGLGSRKDSQPRPQSNLEMDGGKGRPGQEQDWPLLSHKRIGDGDGLKTGLLSQDVDKGMSSGRKPVENSWTSTLKNTASGTVLAPGPLQSTLSAQSQKKTVAVLSSPVKVKMVTGRSSRGTVSSPREPPFGHPIAEERLIPKLSTDSNLSHMSLRSEDRHSLESNVSGLYVPPHAAAESRLRATKSATPLEDDPVRDYSSMEAMLRRRISVPERVVDEAATTLLSTTSSRRGPPPGFNRLQGRASAHAALDRSAASDRMLQARLSYEAAADAINRQAMPGTLIDQLAQNMMPAQPNSDLSASLLAAQNPREGVGLQNQPFMGSLESPFLGTGGQQNIGQSNAGYPLSYNSGMQNDILQSLMSASSGLGLYGLQGKSSTQLSGRGSVPTMQTRLSADAIDGTAIFDFEALQKSQLGADGNPPHALNAFLNRQDARGLPGQQAHKLSMERTAAQQNLAFAQDLTSQATQSPFNDPAVLAFKKSGQQEMFQMGLPGCAVSDQLMPVREQSVMAPTPFDDLGHGTGGLWASGMNMPVTPFMDPPPQQTDLNQPQWMNVSAGVSHSPGTGASVGLYTHPVSDQTIDAAGLFYPDKVSSTRT